MGLVRQNPIQRTVSLFMCVCIALCTIVAHNIAQNRPDSFPPYPPDNHHYSDDVYLREGGQKFKIKNCYRFQWHLAYETQEFIYRHNSPDLNLVDYKVLRINNAAAIRIRHMISESRSTG